MQLSSYVLNHPSYKYAQDVVTGKSSANRYIQKQCQKFLDDLEDESCKYFFDEDDLQLIDDLLKLVKMADGHRVGMSAYEALAPFQWFFLANTLGWKHKANPDKRRYQKSVLLIARKNGEFRLAFQKCLAVIGENRKKSFTFYSFYVIID